MGTTDIAEAENPPFDEDRDRQRMIRRPATRIAVVLAIVLLAITAVCSVCINHCSQKRAKFLRDMSQKKIVWRVHLVRKAMGEIPDLSWTDLWQMTGHQGGFGLSHIAAGLSVDASVINQYDSNADHQAAASIFSSRCVMCHGNDGAGGSIGPALNHSGLRHGDSDLDIYKVLRDGVPNTAMRAPSISVTQRWQLVGYIKQLQLHGIGLVGLGGGSGPLDIEVSSQRIISAGSKTDEWLTYSGSLDGHRYTPLNQITPGNVSQLRTRWVRQFDTTLPSIEATPLVVGGVMFVTEPPSDMIAVDAINAKSGELIWRYARSIPADVHACCGRVNRGLAILGNHIFLASMEGYLVCLDASTGKLVWETKVDDPSQSYSLSMAPLIVNRSVVVGVAGAEYAIRGFLAAYDAETGEKQWQFNTIPGIQGEPGHETQSGDSWRTAVEAQHGLREVTTQLSTFSIGELGIRLLCFFRRRSRIGDNLYTDSA